MDLPVMLVSMSPFLMVVAIVWIAMSTVSRNRRATLKVVEEAIRNGQEMTPETIRALGMPRKDTNGDLKSGAILIAIALAMVVLGFAIYGMDGDEEAVIILPAIAAFPGLIGLVLIGFGLFGKKDQT